MASPSSDITSWSNITGLITVTVNIKGNWGNSSQGQLDLVQQITTRTYSRQLTLS